MSEEDLKLLEDIRAELGRWAEFRRRHLGVNVEEQNGTLRLLRGLTPREVREALSQYRDAHSVSEDVEELQQIRHRRTTSRRFDD